MNEENLQDEGLSLKDIFDIFRRHWIGILVCTIIGSVVGLGIGLTTPDKYKASQKVYISNSTTDSSEIVDSLRIIETFDDYIKDVEVAKETISLVKDSAEKNNLDIDVDSINYTSIISGLTSSKNSDNTLCLTISYTHTDALTAKVILENVILASRNVANYGDGVTMFKDRINTQTSFDKLGTGECATVTKTSKGTSLYLALGLIVGVVCGAVYAFVIESLDNTVKVKHYIENKYKVRVIGSIPEILEDINNEEK